MTTKKTKTEKQYPAWNIKKVSFVFKACMITIKHMEIFQYEF